MTDLFRSEYRVLSDLEKDHVARVKACASEMARLLQQGSKPLDARCVSLARTKLEECVMWATKAITG